MYKSFVHDLINFLLPYSDPLSHFILEYLQQRCFEENIFGVKFILEMIKHAAKQNASRILCLI